MERTLIHPGFLGAGAVQHFPAGAFPSVHPVGWLNAHFAVGGWSPLQRLSGMLTAHVTRIAPLSGFTWHPHRGLEIYTWVLEGRLHHEDTTGGRGDIGSGELQRMFSGDWIEHQELNLTDEPVRVVQIWYAADPRYRGLAPHYQQPARADFPVRREGGVEVRRLIGDGSPMAQHAAARLSATRLEPGAAAPLELPRADEDLFLYVTDGAGRWQGGEGAGPLGQYDVQLAGARAAPVTLTAADDLPLHYLSFYLPRFLA